MRKRLKTTKKQAKKHGRLAPAVIIALAIIAIAAVTVISKVREATTVKGSTAPMTNAANRTTTIVKAAAQDEQINDQIGQSRELTPEEAQRMAEALKQTVNKSTEGLVQEQQADGSVSMDLQGRFQSATVAKINDDGSVSTVCVDTPEAGAAFLGIDPQLVGSNRDAGTRTRQQTRVKPAKN